MRRFTPYVLTAVFTAGACVSVALLFWFGYRAVTEWQSKSVLLAERQSSDAADLLLTALTRDMGGAQASVLTSPQWNQFAADHPHEMNALVASAFARYPYPEAFFAWKRGMPFEQSVVFYRADRRPNWAFDPKADTVFPVINGYEPKVISALFARIDSDSSRGRNLSFFNIDLEGQPYQVVAQLVYDDIYRQRLASVVGFTVNLEWVRQHYFSELTQQVWNIGHGADTGLVMRINDAKGELVAGDRFEPTAPLSHSRSFELLFVDGQSAFPVSHSFAPDTWSVVVSGGQSVFLSRDSAEANRVLAFVAVSSLLFAVGLIMTARAVRANTHLTNMRSDFVSAVTHDIKTPIATIKAAAETLAKDRLTKMSVRTCGRILVMESSRLGRLVENLLAYARMTEVTESYRLQPVEVAAIFNDIQQDFEARLDQHGFELRLDVARDARVVTGDRFALRLLFGNLVDNAIKYSTERRTVSLSAVRSDSLIRISVSDEGVGIAPEDLAKVTRKFVRASGAPGGGSGLGLAIATRIAEDHNGRLQIESTPGEGTTVSVTLPAPDSSIEHVA